MTRFELSGQAIPYLRIRERLQTGDLVLFHGLDLESEIIEIFEHSLWSHVGMVVRMPCLDYPLLWESTPLHFLTDPLLHRPKSGPRLVCLDDRLALSLDKGLYDRFMVRPLLIKRSTAMLRALNAFIAEVHRLTFPGNWEMIREFLEGRLLKTPPGTRRSFYCAELVAETYMRMGLLSKTPPSNAYLPKNFAPQGQLALQVGAKLGPGVLISYRGA
jgi:hypothetical protein